LVTVTEGEDEVTYIKKTIISKVYERQKIDDVFQMVLVDSSTDVLIPLDNKTNEVQKLQELIDTHDTMSTNITTSKAQLEAL